MADEVVTRTYTTSVRNQSRVQNGLDSLGFAASKLWNVGRWVCDRICVLSDAALAGDIAA
ncbi:hypothetical protein BRD17_08100 [Halobacteriales archaeon SW_7_68_16]|nr:MAG: hypothetical protein BRD17_08100 [Halobacteriales archaeon SW_7_68_16]